MPFLCPGKHCKHNLSVLLDEENEILGILQLYPLGKQQRQVHHPLNLEDKKPQIMKAFLSAIHISKILFIQQLNVSKPNGLEEILF